MSASDCIRLGVQGSLQTAAAAVIHTYELNKTGRVNQAILDAWEKLKKNLPPGPYNIAQVMQVIELSLLEKNNGAEEGATLILRANDLFNKLVAMLIPPLSDCNLLNECSQPVTETLLCRIQEGFQAIENEALRKLWGQLIEQAHFPVIEGGHEAMRAWLQSPEHAEQIQAITTLDLRGLNFRFLPPEIGLFTSLQTLDLRNNNLHSLPETFGNLASLAELNLRENQLSALPASFGDLSSLRILNVEHNRFYSLPPPILQLNALNMIGLSYNQLESLPHQVGNLRNLTHLYLNHNLLKMLPSTIKDLQNLICLECCHNQIETLPEEICQLTALRELYLWQNKLISIPESIGGLRSLESLYINNNMISSLPQSIGSLSALTIFRFNNNMISELPFSISLASHLKKINLSFNQITTLPDWVFEMESTVFNVNGNPLMFLSNEALKYDFHKYVSPAELFPHYAKSFNHTCLSPLASLFQAIIQNESTEALEEAFEKLNASLQNQIIDNVSVSAFIFNPQAQRIGLRAQTEHLTAQYLESAQIGTSAPTSLKGRDLFGDKTRFARAVRDAAYTNYRLLTPEEIEDVRIQVRRLAGKLESDWGKEHLFDHMLRFVDALEIVRGQIDPIAAASAPSSSGSRIGNTLKKLFKRK